MDEFVEHMIFDTPSLMRKKRKGKHHTEYFYFTYLPSIHYY